MNQERLSFLKRLMDEACPTGREQPAARAWRAEAGGFADRTWVDTHGNSFAVVNEGAEPRIMLAGHVDEIGLMITHVDEQGYLWITGLGGWDRQVLPGQRVRILTDSGPVLGVIGRKAIHILKPEERKKVVEFEDVWIDIGVNSREEALEVVRIGDAAVLDYGFEILRGELAVARAFDDRVGSFIVLEAARRAKELGATASIVAVATVQEEIGKRGATTSAFGIDPHIGIAVDVGQATDTPQTDACKKAYGQAKLGGGPMIARGPNMTPLFVEELIATAVKNSIPYQIEPCPRGTGTDANAIQLTREGVVTGLISIPNRYMHSPCEVVHLGDLDHIIELMAQTMAGIDENSTFLEEV